MNRYPITAGSYSGSAVSMEVTAPATSCDDRALDLVGRLNRAHEALSQITAADQPTAATGNTPAARPGLIESLGMAIDQAEQLVYRIERLASVVGRL